MNDKRINLQYLCHKMYSKKCNVYLVHTHVVQGCHPHWGQLVAIVSQAQLSIAIIAPAIHLREREDKLYKLPTGTEGLSYADQILQTYTVGYRVLQMQSR